MIKMLNPPYKSAFVGNSPPTFTHTAVKTGGNDDSNHVVRIIAKASRLYTSLPPTLATAKRLEWTLGLSRDTLLPAETGFSRPIPLKESGVNYLHYLKAAESFAQQLLTDEKSLELYGIEKEEKLDDVIDTVLLIRSMDFPDPALKNSFLTLRELNSSVMEELYPPEKKGFAKLFAPIIKLFPNK